MSDLAQLLARTPHVLLDFDGPVCAVFGGTSDRSVADALRANLPGLPAEVIASSDPFDVLRHAATLGRGTLAAVAHEFTRLEVHAVATATPTPGAVETISTLHAAGYTVTIVSNNSEAAVASYIAAQGLTDLIDGISARIEPAPDLLKPNPHLLRRAIADLCTQSKHCVLIGDSSTDISAAHAANVHVIAYANKVGKREHFEKLEPDLIIDTMFAVPDALSASIRRSPRTL